MQTREEHSSYAVHVKGTPLPKANFGPNTTHQKKTGDDSSVVLFLKYMKSVLHDFKCATIKLYAGVTQVLIWFVLWSILRFCFKIRIHGRENLAGLRGPLIIAANHQRFYDAFLIRIAIGFWSPLLPLRFMGTKKFADPFLKVMKIIGVVDLVYITMGTFTVEQGLGLNKNLKRAKGILRNKGVVAMFPEGRMNKGGNLSMFKRGVSALALSTNTKVLPIGIKIHRRQPGKVTNRSVTKTHIDIFIGTAKTLETHHTYDELAEMLRGDVQLLIK